MYKGVTLPFLLRASQLRLTQALPGQLVMFKIARAPQKSNFPIIHYTTTQSKSQGEHTFERTLNRTFVPLGEEPNIRSIERPPAANCGSCKPAAKSNSIAAANLNQLQIYNLKI